MGKNTKTVVQPEPDIEDETSEEEVALDEDDVEEAVLDEDVIPKQKVEIDNTVRKCARLYLSKYDDPRLSLSLFTNRTPFVAYARRSNSTLHYHGRKPSSSLSQKPSRSTSMMT